MSEFVHKTITVRGNEHHLTTMDGPANIARQIGIPPATR